MILKETNDSEGILKDFIDQNCEDWGKEYVLYLYYAANYYKRECFFYIVKKIDDLSLPQVEQVMELLREPKAYEVLSDHESK